MSRLDDLITLTDYDVVEFECKRSDGRVWSMLNIILEELPNDLKQKADAVEPSLKPITGFEDEKIKGYEIIFNGSKEIENFVKEYIPFFIVKKV